MTGSLTCLYSGLEKRHVYTLPMLSRKYYKSTHSPTLLVTSFLSKSKHTLDNTFDENLHHFSFRFISFAFIVALLRDVCTFHLHHCGMVQYQTQTELQWVAIKLYAATLGDSYWTPSPLTESFHQCPDGILL